MNRIFNTILNVIAKRHEEAISKKKITSMPWCASDTPKCSNYNFSACFTHRIAITISFTLFFLSAFSQVQIQFEEDSVLLGDYIHFKASVKTNPNTQYFFPEFKDSLGAFEIIETFPIDTLEKELSRQYIVSQYYPGIFGLDSFPVFALSNGQIDTFYSLNPIQVFVKPIAIDTAQGFKPIVGPISEPLTFKEILPWLLLAFIPIIIVVLVYFLSKRKEKILFEKQKPKTPIEFYGEALSALKALDKKKLWQNGNVKEYYFELSRILRNYLEGRYQFQAMESTTDEIMASISNFNIADGLKNKLKNTLQQADLAKFAKYQPLGDENSMSMKNALDFVTHTKPVIQIEDNEKKE